jgi:asparagine synthase (glutamine-hydrolysing)
MLAPAHVLVCDDGPPCVGPYWEFPSEAGEPSSLGESTVMLRAKLEESVRLRQAAAVPVGALLSGGIDSSAVVALMARTASRPIQTFCAGFDELPFCERASARRVAEHLGTDHHEVVLDAGTVDLLPQLAADLGEPLADASLLPTYVVSRLTRGHVKAVLSGDGGDEIFGGYSTYAAALRHERLRWLPGGARRLLGAFGRGLDPRSELRRKLKRIPLSVLERHVEAMAGFSCSDLERALSPELRHAASEQDPFAAWHEPYTKAARARGNVPALLYLDALTYLPGDILRKVDCASMRCSLEVRVPLLDHQVVEFAASLPLSYKVRDGMTKWILRESVRDLLPPATLTRVKKGFTIPLARWFQGPFGRLARETLLDSRAARRGWTNQSEVERLVAHAGSSSSQGSTLHHLWSLVMLELWAQHHVDQGITVANRIEC